MRGAKIPGQVRLEEAKERGNLRSQVTASEDRWRTVCNPRHAWECWAPRELDRGAGRKTAEEKKIS